MQPDLNVSSSSEQSPFIKDLEELINDRAYDRYFADYAREGVTSGDFLKNGWTWAIDTTGVELISLGIEFEPFEPKMNPLVIARKESINKEELAIKETFSVHKQTAFTFQWAITEGLKLGSKQVIKAGIPKIAQGEIDVSEELNIGSTQTTTKGDMQTWTDTQEIPVPPFRIVEMRFAVQQATMSPRFSARLRVTGTVVAGMVRPSKHESAQETYQVEEILGPDETIQTVRGQFHGVVGLRLQHETEEFYLDGTPVKPPRVVVREGSSRAEARQGP